MLIEVHSLNFEAELVKLQASAMKSMTPEERKTVRLARVRAQNERLRPSIEKALGKPDPDAETPTAEELQQLLLEDGVVKPEDNIGSRAIIEERERLHEGVSKM